MKTKLLKQFSPLLLILIILFMGCDSGESDSKNYVFLQSLDHVKSIEIIIYHESSLDVEDYQDLLKTPPEPEILKVLSQEEKDAFLYELQKIDSGQHRHEPPETTSQCDHSKGVKINYSDGAYEITMGYHQIRYSNGTYNRWSVNYFDQAQLLELINRYLDD